MRTIKAIAGAVLAGGLIAAGVLLGTGDDGTSATVDAYGKEHARAVRLQGTCPEPAAPDSKEPAKCVATTQMDGWCLCLTPQPAGQVDGEVASANAVPTKDRYRLVVCDDDGGGTVVIWQPLSQSVGPRCTEVVANVIMPGISMTAVETGVEEQLRAVCDPCPVTAGSWGPCPHCLRWPGGCAEACR